MKNSKKNAFTLVELLAVLVILAVILVIAIPKVMSIISDVRKSTLESTAKLIASSAEKKKMENEIIGNDEILTCDNVVKINDVDYESCIIEFIDGRAVVTIIGKGNFKGMSICDGTKNDVKISDRCLNKAVEVTIELNNGNTIVETYKEGTVLELESPTKENSTFLRFEVVSGNSTLVDNKLTVGSDDTIVYALYEVWPNLSIDLDGGVSSIDQSGIYKSNSVIELVEPTKEGYTFTGWIRESGNGILSGSTLTIGSENTVVKATWKDYPKLIVDLNGGTDNINYEERYLLGTTIELVEPTREGYTFTGWTSTNGSVNENIFIMGNVDTTIEALWSANTYEVVMDANGGSISSESFTDPKEYIYSVDVTGKYKLEVWGAQGGNVEGTTKENVNLKLIGGYGGYSYGNVDLEKNQTLSIVVGGKGIGGNPTETTIGGYNGGGSVLIYEEDIAENRFFASGGGATHIALVSRGELKNFNKNEYLSELLIVAGGGGGAYMHTTPGYYGNGGSGGGINGVTGEVSELSDNSGTGGTQTSAGNSGGISGYGEGGFGIGGSVTTMAHGSAGGGGYYGGGASSGVSLGIDYHGNSSGGGGSGYIGNTLLSSKGMYCYNCKTSSDNNTFTKTTTNKSNSPISNYVKEGDGAAKVSLLSTTSVIKYDEIYGDLPIPEREGYTFVGWNTKKDGTGNIITNTTKLTSISNNIIYAIWNANTYEVILDANGGSISSKLFTDVKEHIYLIKETGKYKLEVWGAQGGSVEGTTKESEKLKLIGGYGGYSYGNIDLEENQTISIVVGGKGIGGNPTEIRNGGYNGGGSVLTYEEDTAESITNRFVASGGGATHIALVSRGELKNFNKNEYLSELLIVAGGGGGAYMHTTPGYYGNGGSGGGINGVTGEVSELSDNSGTGGTQTSAGNSGGISGYGEGEFGIGGSVTTMAHGSAGGGGYYGGGASSGFTGSKDNPLKGNSSGGGGSGYIGNTLLSSKGMYCYNCKTSSDNNTFTKTTTNKSNSPISNYVKEGDGAAKVSLLSTTSVIKYDDTYENLPIPEREGYTFVGWNTKKDGTGNIITNTTKLTNKNEIALYAIWK